MLRQFFTVDEMSTMVLPSLELLALPCKIPYCATKTSGTRAQTPVKLKYFASLIMPCL